MSEKGKRYGLWTVMSKPEPGKGGCLYVFCQCDCGEVRSVRLISLKRGQSTKCGGMCPKHQESVIASLPPGSVDTLDKWCEVFGSDKGFKPKNVPEPTTHEPGTTGKMNVIQWRLENGYELHHEFDAPIGGYRDPDDEDESYYFETMYHETAKFKDITEGLENE